MNAASARVLLVSHRFIKPHVSWANVFELEDVICEVDDVDLLAPKLVEPKALPGEAAVITQLRRRLGIEVQRRPQIEKTSLTRSYDLLFLSVMTLADRMDAGDVLGRRATAIEPTETAGELHDRLADLGPEVVLEVLSAFRDGSLKPETQDESLATHARKLTKADGTVDFADASDAVRAKVHGLTPWPGCTVLLEGARLKLLRVDLGGTRNPLAMPGMIQEDLSVACGQGAIRLLSVQPPGGKAMTFESYCHGHDVQPGERFVPL